MLDFPLPNLGKPGLGQGWTPNSKLRPDLREKPYWGNHFWSKGYCVDTVGLDSEMILNIYLMYNVIFQAKEIKSPILQHSHTSIEGWNQPDHRAPPSRGEPKQGPSPVYQRRDLRWARIFTVGLFYTFQSRSFERKEGYSCRRKSSLRGDCETLGVFELHEKPKFILSGLMRSEAGIPAPPFGQRISQHYRRYF